MTEQAGPQMPQDAMQRPAVSVAGVEGVNPAEVQVTPERIEGSRSLNLADLEPLTDPSEFNEQTGLLASLMATVQVGNSAVGIIDRTTFLGSRDEPISTDIIWMGKASEGGNSQIIRTKNSIYAVAMKPDGGIYLDEKGRPKLFGLESGRSLSIGRDQDNDISLDDGFVSSRHADLAYDEETKQINVTDRDSTNGTFIETKPKEKGEAVGDETLQVPDEETNPNRSHGDWWDGAVDAAKTEVGEALPEPPRSVEDTEYMGELPPPYNSDAAGEQAPQNPSIYFESPQTLLAALNDQEMDPRLRAELRGVVTAWQELQHSELARVLWEETIQPRLGNLAELHLPEQAQQIQNLSTEIQQQAEGWKILTNRLYDGYSEQAEQMAIVRKYELGIPKADQLFGAYHAIAQDDRLQRSSQVLGLETEEVNAKVRRLGQNIDGRTLEDTEAQMLIEKMQEMGIHDRPLAEIAHDLRGEVTFGAWRSIVRNIEELTTLTEGGLRKFGNADLDNGMSIIKQMYYDFEDNRKHGRGLDIELTPQILRRTTEVAGVLDRLARVLAIATDEAAWINSRG